MIGFKEFLDTDEEAKTVKWQTTKKKLGVAGAMKKKKEDKNDTKRTN